MPADPGLAPRTYFELEGLPFADLLDVPQAWDALGPRLTAWLGRHLRPGISGRVAEGAWLVGEDIQIGEGSVVEPGAYIKGPCVIGRNVEVRHGAYIRGHAVIGDGCVVGHATEVKGSIFLPGARAGHFAYVGDSILGRDVNLGAGTKLANLRLQGDMITVRVGGQIVPTGLRKLGAVLGDGCQLGCNSVTNPGTLLGPGTMVSPCVAVSGIHPARSVIRE